MADPSVTHEPDGARPVRKVAVPPSARELSTLAHVGYADTFLVDVGRVDQRTAEQWARAVMEEAPAHIRHMLRAGWTAIGLKLDGAPPDRSVLGWEIRRCAPDHVLLGADSRSGMAAELLFKREPDGLLFATFVEHRNAVARGVWAGVEPAHVPIVRSLLDQASRRACG